MKKLISVALWGLVTNAYSSTSLSNKSTGKLESLFEIKIGEKKESILKNKNLKNCSLYGKECGMTLYTCDTVKDFLSWAILSFNRNDELYSMRFAFKGRRNYCSTDAYEGLVGKFGPPMKKEPLEKRPHFIGMSEWGGECSGNGCFASGWKDGDVFALAAVLPLASGNCLMEVAVLDLKKNQQVEIENSKCEMKSVNEKSQKMGF